MVSVLLGVMVFSAVVEVMSPLAPLPAAFKLFRAFAAVVAPVPPCVTDKAEVKPESDVMSLFAPLAAAPRLVRAPKPVVAFVPPLATVNGLLRFKPAKVGLAAVPISCTVFTVPAMTLKLLALNCAMPFCVVEALLMVIVVPEPLVLAIVSAPVKLSKLATPALAEAQLVKLRSPLPSVAKHCPTVPSAVGNVNVWSLAMEPGCSVTLKPLAALCRLNPANVGVEVVAMSCGRAITTSPVLAETNTWFGVPVRLETFGCNTVSSAPLVTLRPVPSATLPVKFPTAVTTLF